MDRRRFLGALGLGSLALAASSRSVLALAQCRRTEPNIEGPFHRPGAPFRSQLAEAWPRGLILSGVVTDTRCRPLAGAVLDIWQADEHGEYDLDGDRFRGQLRTDARGGYQLRTVHPGAYQNGGTYRPSHIHVKVHADGRPPLTTQLYFPNDPHADRDPWFRSSLVIAMQPHGCTPRPSQGRFDFVV